MDLNDAQWGTDQWDEIICIFGHFPKVLCEKTLQGVKKTVEPGEYFITEVINCLIRAEDLKTSNFLYKPEEFLAVFSD